MNDQTKQTPTLKKAYHSPVLRVYGDVRDLTLAPTPTRTGESGRGKKYNRQ